MDKICGPGNVFVAYAKKLVQGAVDIDGIFGPTETIVIADDTANPAFCAADLIAQAEHDPLATAILITNSPVLVSQIEDELDRQLAAISRGPLARQALERQGRIVLLDSLDQAVDLANAIAPEHLCLMVSEPWAWAGQVKNAGGLFLGEFSPRGHGRLHRRPQPRHAHRRHRPLQFCPQRPPVPPHHARRRPQHHDFQALGAAAVQIAQAEGLSGHSEAIQVRLDYLQEHP